MKDKDSQLIFEAYLTEREYGPSAAPSINPEDWEIDAIYTSSEWDSPGESPWDKHIDAVQKDIRAVDDVYILFFGPKQGSETYVNWQNPGIVVAVEVDREGEYARSWSSPIFVIDDGAGEAHKLHPDIAEALINLNDGALIDYASSSGGGSYNPLGRDGVADQSDFMPRGDF